MIDEEKRAGNLFPQTAWTLVRRVQNGGQQNAEIALEALCKAYWEPVCRYLKALGCPDSDAEDVTQEFFASFLRTGGFDRADATLARLRTFIKHAAGHYLSNWRRSKLAQRRGAGVELAGMDDAENVANEMQAGALYDREWARTVLDRALSALEKSYADRGRSGIFDGVKVGLLRPGGVPDITNVALNLGVTESQVRLAVHRARTRLADLLRAEVRPLVDGEAEVESEVRYLISTIANEG